MKFAYLIMAHDNEEQLRILIDALDYKENDIYLHIDNKSSIKKKKFEVSNATIHVYSKFSVYWGDLSQTKCQIFLLNEAIKTYHDYYHLISGHDFPIKSHSEILAFFKKNAGKQFIHFESQSYCMKDACRYYHLFAPLVVRCKNEYFKEKISKVETALIEVQRKMNIKRNLFCGANWYSITHGLAVDFCSKKRKIIKKVKWTLSSDEYVLQTFYRTMTVQKYELYAETKEPGDYNGGAREIDWYRGIPYVWRNEDFDYLIKSDSIFARKFDQKIDMAIIKRIYNAIKE